jgi:hypothetical protein
VVEFVWREDVREGVKGKKKMEAFVGRGKAKGASFFRFAAKRQRLVLAGRAKCLVSAEKKERSLFSLVAEFTGVKFYFWCNQCFEKNYFGRK